jgi:LPS export ABC transporter protein LptC
MRTLLVIGSALVVLAALVQWFTVSQTRRERAADLPSGPANVLTLTHAVMNQTEGNTLRLQVWADKVTYSEERARAHLLNVRFVGYPTPEQEIPQDPIEGVAAEADIRGGTSLIELVGSVHIRQGARTELRGERLLYDYGAGLITSDEPVWIRHDRTFHEGATLHYSIPGQRARLTRPFVWE